MFSGTRVGCHTVYNSIFWFLRRIQILVIVTLAGSFTQNPTPIYLPLKKYPGTYWHNKIVKKYQSGRIYFLGESISLLKMTQGNEISVLNVIPTPPILLPYTTNWWPWGQEQYYIKLLEETSNQTDFFFNSFSIHSVWSSFQWNTHTPLPLLKDVYHLWFFLLQVMIGVSRSLVSETT